MDPYVEACDALERSGVAYVAVGVFAINLYAERAGYVLTTADCDLLLPADPTPVTQALATLRALGYALEAGGELLVEDPVVVAGIVRARARVTALREGAQIDLALEVAGASFDDLWAGQRRFEVEGVLLRVAALPDLVRAKELAGRPKDRLFLETHRDAIEDLLRGARADPMSDQG